MGLAALGLSAFAALAVAIVYATVSCVAYWRQRSAARRVACWTSVLAIPLLYPSFQLVLAGERRGLPLFKPGLPDPASGEAVMLVLLSMLTAYLVALIVAGIIHRLS